MRSIRLPLWAAVLVSTLLLASCGGGSSSGSGQVRMVNATRTHASLDLLSSGTKIAGIGGVTAGTVSAYAGVGAGTPTLQVADAGSLTALASSGPSVTKDQSYTLVAYETNGAIKSAWISENDTTPTSGTASLRVLDLASDAGPLDVYVTAPETVLTSGVAPTFSFGTSTGVQTSVLQSFTPGTYRVRVTAAGNQADVRAELASVSLANQQLVNVVLTPMTGAGLINAATLVAKGAYTASTNGNARVRIASGVPGALVAVSQGSRVVEAGAVSPTIGSYFTVPAGSAAWAVTVNGGAAAVPPITLAAGSDNTLLVSGTTAAASAAVLADDNHVPASTSSSNIRIVNGLAGTTSGLSLSVDFALVASNVTPGSASAYRTVSGNTSMRLEVDSPLSAVPVSLQTGLSVLGGGVYTVFVLGDATAPLTVLRRDR